MDALILSCSTGGGHNAAGRAMQEALEARGHHVTMLDPYDLQNPGLGKKVGDAYVGMVQRAPRMFGCIYGLGQVYRRLPIRSPVYYVNEKMDSILEDYLANHPCDVILMPHVFPAEILTTMKRRGIPVPKTVFIATDYTCIPFTEETDCDYYVTPGAVLNEDFISRGIPGEKLLSFGIPVKAAFRGPKDRSAAARRLGMAEKKHYLLLAGGSIGAGKIRYTMESLQEYLSARPDTVLITICGRHQALYLRLLKEFGENPQILLLKSTDQMADYMTLCDVLLSKPGGLTSTEAAVRGIPLIHLSPIPGCEDRNAAFFQKEGMSIRVGTGKGQLLAALKKLEDPQAAREMMARQRAVINPRGAEDLADFLETWLQTRA